MAQLRVPNRHLLLGPLALMQIHAEVLGAHGTRALTLPWYALIEIL
jgi:hypothetical protein